MYKVTGLFSRWWSHALAISKKNIPYLAPVSTFQKQFLHHTWEVQSLLLCFCAECGMNVHHKCQKKVANLCGVNQKLMAEALAIIESKQQVRTAKLHLHRTDSGFLWTWSVSVPVSLMDTKHCSHKYHRKCSVFWCLISVLQFWLRSFAT